MRASSLAGPRHGADKCELTWQAADLTGTSQFNARSELIMNTNSNKILNAVLARLAYQSHPTKADYERAIELIAELPERDRVHAHAMAGFLFRLLAPIKPIVG